MIHTGLFLSHWWHFFYAPKGQPWYQGAVWGNFFVIPIIAAAGYLWSKTKFWPLSQTTRALRELHAKFDTHWSRQQEHNEWMAKTLARVHWEATGKRPPKHPHFGDLGPRKAKP